MCGIFGAVSSEPVASKIIFGAYDLQHRGEQGAGAVVSDRGKFETYKGFGLVSSVFDSSKKEDVITRLSGHCGISHTLYSTIGRKGEEKQTKNIQPLVGEFHGKPLAVALNGNLVELESLRDMTRGYQFRSEVSDTEVILALLSTSPEKDFVKALLRVLPLLKGAFSLVILFDEKVIGVRCNRGIRPLCIGRDSKSIMLASESCAFYTERGSFVRDVEPGEIVILGPGGLEKSFFWTEERSLNICIIEYIYFARPESRIDHRSVYGYRYNAGEILQGEHPVEADIICPVPDSGKIYDDGLACASGICRKPAIFRNRYVTTRTFLTPREIDKRALQRMKLHVLREVIHNKRVLFTEDSIIRGNVSPEVAAMLREDGATEVHERIGSAPIRFPCSLGIDIPTRVELVAANLTEQEIGKQIVQADSLHYLSLEGMVKAISLPRENLCLGCFIGKYPKGCKNCV